MKKYFFIVLFIFLFLILFFFLRNTYSVSQVHTVLNTASVATLDYKDKVILKGTPFKALISDTEELRAKGLSGFKSLPDNEVMLFVFEKATKAGFWMKDMLFPLDIVWLDNDMNIIHTEENLSPDSFPQIFAPAYPARYVIELMAGTLARLGVKKGDTVSLPSGK